MLCLNGWHMGTVRVLLEECKGPMRPAHRLRTPRADPSKAAENPFIRPDFFMRREFSFTVADDVYIRYLCFRDGEEMRKAIIAKQPHKIDIGAAYSFPVRPCARRGLRAGWH